MTWNYRVVKHTQMLVDDEPYDWFDIREVYRDGNSISWSDGSKPPVGDTVEELKADLNMMLQALDRPILEEKGDTLVKVAKR